LKPPDRKSSSDSPDTEISPVLLFQTLQGFLPEFIQRMLVVASENATLTKSSFPQKLEDADHSERVVEFATPSYLEALLEQNSYAKYDAILFCPDTERPFDFVPYVHIISKALTPQGWIFWVTRSEPCSADLLDRLNDVNMELYVIWDAMPSSLVASPQPFSWVRRTRQDEIKGDPVLFHCLAFVPKNYDPLAHARALLLDGAPGPAFNVLTFVPEVYLENPPVRAAVKAEQALCLLAWDQAASDGLTLPRFHLAQAFFAQATAADPHCHLAYCVQAEFWHRLGDDYMAARTLRSIQHVAPQETTATQLNTYTSHPAVPTKPWEPPEWNEGTSLPRILLITDNRPNYGLDVLYAGLFRVLGADHVLEFPHKPTLHGGQPERFADYPCCFCLPGEAVTLEQVCDELRSGRFDLLLFGDVERTLEREQALQVVRAADRIPVFLLDMLDDFRDNRPEVCDWLQLKHFAGYFKREMLTCVSYGNGVFPLPFAYPEERMPTSFPEDRPYLLFWAGQRQFGIRKLALEYLERRFNVDFSTRYTQAEYVSILQSSHIGLDFSGFGFDTVRYWEVPAHGAMLLAERRPTCIPFDFTDGESAVFFDDIPDLEKKLLYYGTHKEETIAIAHRGYDHVKRYHTATLRAKHLLGWIAQTMR